MFYNESWEPQLHLSRPGLATKYRVFLERSLAGRTLTRTGSLVRTGDSNAGWSSEVQWRDQWAASALSQSSDLHMETQEWSHSGDTAQPPPLPPSQHHSPHHAAAPPWAWQEHRGVSLSPLLVSLQYTTVWSVGLTQLIVKKQLTNHNIPSQA